MKKMDRFNRNLSIHIAVKFILLLVLTCDAQTIDDCSDFVSVKVWKFRRQLLIHRSNDFWVREVAAWESSHSYAYVLREMTDGKRSFQGIYDENMTLRSCQITDGYTADSNSGLVPDARRECRQTASTVNRETDGVLEKLLRTHSHSASTFDDTRKFLDAAGVSYRWRDGAHRDLNDDTVRVKNRPSEAEDGPSLEVYRHLSNAVPPALESFANFDETLQMCSELNIDAINQNMIQASSWSSYLPKALLDLPGKLRKQMEALGLLDEAEEEEDLYDIVEEDYHVIPGGGADDHHERQKRGLFMFPGTLWCGTGNRAPAYSSLGMYNKTDACCREHDHSTTNMSITAGESKYNFKNWAMFTISHCSVDKRFHKCLRQVKNMAAYEVGRGFFNVFNINCFVIRNRKQCLENYWYMPWRCKKHAYLPTACLRKAQVFPSMKYVWPT